MGAADQHVLCLANEMLTGDGLMREELVTNGDPCAASSEPARDKDKVLRKFSPQDVLRFDTIDQKVGIPCRPRR